MTEVVVHEFVPSARDDLDVVHEDDLLDRVFVVHEFTADIRSKYTNDDGEPRTYTEVIVDRGDGEKVTWRTGSGTISDQLKTQTLPFRTTLKKVLSKNGYKYTSFAPASEAGGGQVADVPF